MCVSDLILEEIIKRSREREKKKAHTYEKLAEHGYLSPPLHIKRFLLSPPPPRKFKSMVFLSKT